MADFAWPTALEPTSFEASLVPNVRQLSSPLSGAGQVIDLVGERWRFTVGLPQSARADSGALEAYLNKLKGGANRALLWHMARPSLLGSLIGTATVNGTQAQGASSLVLAGAYPALNLARFTEAFDNAAWAKSNVSVTANATTAPDGTTTADKIAESTTVTSTFNAIQTVGSFTAGQTVTWSCYLKAAERSEVQFRVSAGGAMAASAYAYINLTTGAFFGLTGALSASATSVGNGWWRCTLTFTTTGTGAVFAAIFLSSGGGTNTYAGVIGNGVFAWGAQVEVSSSASTYIGFGTLKAGDMLGLAGMLLQVSDDCVADAAGAMTVPLVTRLRKAVTTGTGLTLTKPTAAFRPVDTGGIVVGHAGRIVREVSIEFLEDY